MKGFFLYKVSKLCPEITGCIQILFINRMRQSDPRVVSGIATAGHSVAHWLALYASVGIGQSPRTAENRATLIQSANKYMQLIKSFSFSGLSYTYWCFRSGCRKGSFHRRQGGWTSNCHRKPFQSVQTSLECGKFYDSIWQSNQCGNYVE